MTDIDTLVIGGVIAIFSSIVTYLVSHFLNIREKKIIRDFEVREKGRDFFHQVYGIVTTLSDMVAPFSEGENAENATILTEKGYVSLSKDKIVELYRKAYQKYSKIWYDSREKGLEIFLMKRYVEILGKFWAYAGYFNDNNNWEEEKENIKKFKAISVEYCDEMDKYMGLCEKESRVPKWLN